MSAIAELGDKLAALSLKDAVELGKYMKDTYGIEAAAELYYNKSAADLTS